MITQFIHREKGVFRSVRNLFHNRNTPIVDQQQRLMVDGIIQHRQREDGVNVEDIQWKSRRASIVPEDDMALARQFADKAYFNDWITVLSFEFKKGDLWTLGMYPFVPNKLEAPPFFVIDQLQEIRHLAMWDNTFKQPRVVGTRPGHVEGLYTFFAPKALRKLREEEKNLVYLQYPKYAPKEAADESAADERRDNEGYSG